MLQIELRLFRAEERQLAFRTTDGAKNLGNSSDPIVVRTCAARNFVESELALGTLDLKLVSRLSMDFICTMQS